jgi:hypothetical protein
MLRALPPGAKSPGIGKQDHRTRVWIDGRRGGELPRAVWRIASLLLPGCDVKPTIRVFGGQGMQNEANLTMNISNALYRFIATKEQLFL